MIFFVGQKQRMGTRPLLQEINYQNSKLLQFTISCSQTDTSKLTLDMNISMDPKHCFLTVQI